MLGVGIAVVAFSQYRRIVWLNKSSLSSAVRNAEGQGQQGAWYHRRLTLHPAEYVVTVIGGSILLLFAWQAFQKRRFIQATGYGALFITLVLVGLALKLRWWHA